jgi:serine/threonine protein kinase
MASNELDLSSGEGMLGPYRILRPISAGGMARVYEARLESLAGVTTRVAIKVILPDYAHEESFKELFITEARLSARLEHQNLVRIQQFNKEGDVYYLVMEYIDGLTFRRVISGCQRNGVRLPMPVIAELGRQLCEGLHYAHTLRSDDGVPLGLVHRDIKPTNVMLNAQGVSKLLDFGISAAHGARDAGDGVKGTWGYMALEQAEQRDVGPAADVFGVAAVLYELAALQPLFPEKEPDAIREALRADQAARRAAALGGPYADLGNVLVRALQRDPSARHRGAASLSRVLSTLVPDPVGIHDALTRLVRDLRHLEGQTTGVFERTRGSGRSSAAIQRSLTGSRPVPPPVAIPIDAAPTAEVAAPPAAVSAGPAGPAPLPPGPPRPARAAGRVPAPPRSAADAAASTPRAWAWVGGAVVLLAALGVWAAWDAPAPAPVQPSEAPPAARAPTPAEVPAAAKPAPKVGPATPPGMTTVAGPPVPAPPPVSPPSEPPRPEPLGPASEAAAGGTAPASASTAQPSETVRPGLLSIGAIPRAQVEIENVFVGFTPLHDYRLAPGTYQVTLKADNFRAKKFEVEVSPGAKVRRVWSFTDEKWSAP